MLRFIRTAFWIPFSCITFHGISFHTPCGHKDGYHKAFPPCRYGRLSLYAILASMTSSRSQP
jgi:hypothetical protein